MKIARLVACALSGFVFALAVNAETSFAEAQSILQTGKYQGREQELLHLFTEARDHPEALEGMGYLYANGIGVEKNLAKARRLYTQAAERGSIPATIQLAQWMIVGRGGPLDVPGAIELLKAARDKGYGLPAQMLGEIYYHGQHAEGQPDYEKAIAEFKIAAGKGGLDAMNYLGVIARDGLYGHTDAVRAGEWFRAAAEQGHGKAALNLALLLDIRHEDLHRREEALQWMHLAAACNEPAAIYYLADFKDVIDPNEWADAEKRTKKFLTAPMR